MTADGLTPGTPVQLDGLKLAFSPVPGDQVTAGSPATGWKELGRFGGLEVGVWEMSEGGMHDVETEEIFIVTAGRASVEIHGGLDGGSTDPSGAAGRVELKPGTLLRLSEGMRTTWTVHETLRKVYVAPS
jgi:uncharacterized protein